MTFQRRLRAVCACIFVRAHFSNTPIQFHRGLHPSSRLTLSHSDETPAPLLVFAWQRLKKVDSHYEPFLKKWRE